MHIYFPCPNSNALLFCEFPSDVLWTISDQRPEREKQRKTEGEKERERQKERERDKLGEIIISNSSFTLSR